MTDGERKLKVLVVDDQAEVRELICEMLTQLGHNPTHCSNGYDCVSAYEAGKRFDLVIMDIMMPGMTGRVAFRKIRQLDPNAVVIAASGYSVKDDLQDMLANGCAGFVAKPFTIKRLDEEIDSALGKSSSI